MYSPAGTKLKSHSGSRECIKGSGLKLQEAAMKKPLLNGTNLLVTAGALALGFMGYVFFASIPDLRRYIRISTM